MITFNIDEDDDFFIGEDKSLDFTVYQSDKRTIQNIANWALSWKLKASLSDADGAALLTKSTTSGVAISGIYNAEPRVNTQKATVTIADTDTDSLNPGRYYHELKRTDPGNETVLSHGRCVLRRGVHRS